MILMFILPLYIGMNIFLAIIGHTDQSVNMDYGSCRTKPFNTVGKILFPGYGIGTLLTLIIVPLFSAIRSLLFKEFQPKLVKPVIPVNTDIGGTMKKKPTMKFATLEKKLQAKGAKNPGALAAYIGRKDLGAKKMAKLSASGRKKSK